MRCPSDTGQAGLDYFQGRRHVVGEQVAAGTYQEPLAPGHGVGGGRKVQPAPDLVALMAGHPAAKRLVLVGASQPASPGGHP